MSPVEADARGRAREEGEEGGGVLLRNGFLDLAHGRSRM